MDAFVKAQTVRGGKPKAGTISHLHSAWLEILRDAVALKVLPLSVITKKKLVMSTSGFSTGERRPSFIREQMEAIRHHMTDAWVNEFPNYRKVCETRYLLRALISLMSCTGITPGLEVETLTPDQVQL